MQDLRFTMLVRAKRGRGGGVVMVKNDHAGGEGHDNAGYGNGDAGGSNGDDNGAGDGDGGGDGKGDAEGHSESDGKCVS